LRYSPDLVVVGFALNDSGNGELGLVRYSDAIRSILTRIKNFGAEAILLTPNMMNTEISPHITDEFLLKLATEFKQLQGGGMLTKYVEASRSVAREVDVPICDIYAAWQAMAAAGVNVTELLSNKLNHPIREMNYYTAMKLVELILS
jgi:hypothetical protein